MGVFSYPLFHKDIARRIFTQESGNYPGIIHFSLQDGQVAAPNRLFLNTLLPSTGCPTVFGQQNNPTCFPV